MVKEGGRSKTKAIVLTVLAFLIVIFLILPITFSLFNGTKIGNVALIPINGVITGNGESMFGQGTISSADIINFIEKADSDFQIQAIVIEINSPGGSAVASDEIAAAIKKVEKPVIALIREVGASGGYWVASATDHVIANRMSITGSIGVISSYLEFSGLMKEYGVGYERLVAGKYKDMGSPFKKLNQEEENLLQGKIDKIHDYFVREIANNRELSESDVKKMATGEFFLGVEAFDNGLVDQLGDKDSAKDYLMETYELKEVDFVVYQRKVGFLDIIAGVMSNMFFSIGEGIGSIFVEQPNSIMLM